MLDLKVDDIFGWPILIGAISVTAYLTITVVLNKKNARAKDWNFNLKKLWASLSIWRWKRKLTTSLDFENVETKMIHDGDSLLFWGSEDKESIILIEIKKRRSHSAEVILLLKTPEGSVYTLPNADNCLFYNALDQQWKAGDLTLTCLEPMVSWRIHFNGLLVEHNGDELHHVRLNLIWNTCSEPIRTPEDTSTCILAETLAKQSWKDPYWLENITELKTKGYEQFGSMIGTINFSESNKDYKLNLPGVKSRKWGQHRIGMLESSTTILGRTTEGHVFTINTSDYSNRINDLQCGNLRHPNGDTFPINWTNIDELMVKDLPNAFKLRFSAGGKDYTAIIHFHNVKNISYGVTADISWNQTVTPLKVGLDSDQGSGILLHWVKTNVTKNIESNDDMLFWKTLNELDGKKICATFAEEAACCPDFVGAKGASLALLYSKRSQDYHVPNGFCLTRNAMDVQIESNEMIKEAIAEIVEAVSKDAKENYLKNACEKAVKLFEETKIPSDVEAEVRKCFNNLHEENKTFAVRSSGIGEDSEELSAAGQNATILGCKNINEVLKGIQKCWASLFTYQSVEYRRQHGQVVNCGMGVVVQTIVDANSAGVMFSRHPNTGNPKEILITSNYGLGETVVSGHVEPDTIILANCNGELKIKEKSVGKKSHKIIVSNDGMQTVELDQGLEKSCSLTDDQCLKLGKLALLQERLWGASRDIEWAIVNDDVYLLQARPITNLTQWTDIELLHEHDTPVMSEYDLLTFGNTGEVLPGAMSPLTTSLTVKALENMSCYVGGTKFSNLFNKLIILTHHRVGLSMYSTMLRTLEKEISISNKIMDIAVFGRPVADEFMFDIAKKRNGYGKIIHNNKIMLDMVYFMWISKKQAEIATELANGINIKLNNMSSLEMYNEIKKYHETFNQICIKHSITTSGSIVSQVIFLSIILKGADEFTADNYNDISTVLSSCNDIVSANIPEGLKTISDAISKSGKSKEFSEMDPSKTATWLQEKCPEVYSLIQNFLQKHGHRCIREFEFTEEPWGMNMIPLMKSLQASVKQNMVSENTSETPLKSIEDLISQLKSPIPNFAKKILKYVIPLCRQSVHSRETTKSALILSVHKLRLAYIALGEQMVKEWRLPSKESIFFLTITEILRCIQTRNPTYVMRAILRKKHYVKWQTFLFPEMNYGVPKPLNFDNEHSYEESGTERKVKGTPVYSGQIVGRACVIKFFNEVDQIQADDILITISTDVGWSPYFPLLGGVVTELGGLISHGAVVAREYGLPCIVGAEGATSMFKTGETVLLDATKGQLIKIDKENNN